MKIARFNAVDRPTYGILDEESQELVVLKGDPLFSGFDTTGARYPLADVKILSPVIPRSKVVGIKGTYLPASLSPAQMVAAKATAHPSGLFLKPNTSVIGPDDPIIFPAWAKQVNFEAELAVVIGKLCKNITPEQAADAIFGYTVANDLGVIVDAENREIDPHYMAACKGFDSACPLGPFIDLDFDPTNVMVRSYLNKEKQQEASTSTLIWSVLEIVSWVSKHFTLLPADVIITGTPAGMGPLTPGDEIEVEVEGIGILRNPVLKENAK